MFNKKKVIVYGIFFVVLIAVFYVTLRPYIVAKDTISVVNSFVFTNQDGRSFSNADTDGKVYIAEFFFTTCTGICPIMNDNLKKIYEKYRNEPDFMIVSFTSDPKTDTVAQLKRYSDSLQVDNNKWVFLTGRKDSLYLMARQSYTLDDPKNNVVSIEDDFIHTQFWALVDRKGNVKKIYDGLKNNEVAALEKEIAKMLKK